MSEAGLSPVLLSGAFDGIQAQDIYLLDRASRLGPVRIYLWDDALTGALRGEAPKFPLAERLYYLNALRYVDRVEPITRLADADTLPAAVPPRGGTWVVSSRRHTPNKEAYCRSHGLSYRVMSDLTGPPSLSSLHYANPNSEKTVKKVLVTGCFDWLHTGHIRFFEEVSELGALYVVIGHDANIRELKGEGHPLFPEDVRRYLVGSIRFVTQALVSTGKGWLDAEPEIDRIQPDIYAVNEDGDRAIKREFCRARGIEYVVLRRLPKEGLPRRESTQLRGF